MTTKTKLTANLSDGTIATRTTARDYQWVIAGQVPLHVRAAQRRLDATYQRDQVIRYNAIADYLTEHPELIPGTEEWVKHDELPAELRTLLGKPGNYSRTDILWTVEKWREYATNSAASAIKADEQAAELQAGPEYGPWGALAWSSRDDLASKEADKWRKHGYRVELVAVNN